MSGDLPWMRALEGTCLAKLGRTAEAHAILDELEHRRDADYADALYVAVLRDALGERAEAFKEIERALDENSAFLYSININASGSIPRRSTIRAAAGLDQDKRMHIVIGETPYPSRRAFCCGLGAALALPMVDLSVLAQAPAVQEAAGPPMLPVRSPGLEHLGLTVPDPEAAAKFYGRIFRRRCCGNGRHRRATT